MRRRSRGSKVGVMKPGTPKKKTRRAAKRSPLSPAPLPMLQGEHTGNEEMLKLLIDISSCRQATEAYIAKHEDAFRWRARAELGARSCEELAICQH